MEQYKHTTGVLETVDDIEYLQVRDHAHAEESLHKGKRFLKTRSKSSKI